MENHVISQKYLEVSQKYLEISWNIMGISWEYYRNITENHRKSRKDIESHGKASTTRGRRAVAWRRVAGGAHGQRALRRAAGGGAHLPHLGGSAWEDPP